MSTLVSARRVTIVAETAIEKLLLTQILALGARGYTCIHVFGKGKHEPMEDPFTGHSRVRIEVVVNLQVAQAILDYVHQPQFAEYALVSYLDEVQIDSRDQWV